LVVEMAETYTVPAGGGDIFRNFVVPVPLSDMRYVRAVDLQPGDPKVVHHVVMAVDTTGISRQEDARDDAAGFDGMLSRQGARPPAGFFVGWTPGRVAKENPEGLAWALAPGSDLVIQMHLRPHDHPADIRAKVALYFTREAPERTPVLLRLGAQTLDIAPDVSDYIVIDSLRLPVDMELLGLYPHAHYLGRSMDVRVRFPNGEEKQLLRIDDWDFNWQDAYTFQRAVALPAGAVIRLRYTYDNTSANPRNPNKPPRRVVYGPNSTDEMAELWIQAVPARRQDLAVLQQELARKSIHDHVQGWEHLLRLNPGDASANAGLAAYHAANGDTARAIQHYERALESQPDYASVHYNLALLHEARGNLAGALSHYGDALRARPGHAGTHNNLGNVLSALGRKAEAATHFQRAVELEPNSAEAHNNLGRALFEAGRVTEALEHYARAVELMPAAAAARFNLAFALASSRRADDAMQQFNEGIRLQPDALEAYVVMAWLLATHPDPQVRQPVRALDLADRAAALLGRSHPRILDAQAAAHAAAGRFDLALPLAREARALADQIGQTQLAARIGDRIRLYDQRKPYVEPR
jgi:tetratricopeptide (TPR) repeat protein